MGLISETVEVVLNSRNIKYYEDLGYKIPKVKNKYGIFTTPKGTTIIVNVKDLSKGSSVLVEVKCDCCENILKPIKWQDYLKCVHKDNKYYCNKCAVKLFSKDNFIKTKLKNSTTFAQWGINNLGEDFLEKYWDYDKNNKLYINPYGITHSSTTEIWIKCQEKDYHGSYNVTSSHFTNMNCRCPFCSGHRTHYLDSLGYLHPEIIGVWSNKNETSPYEYRVNSNEYVYWKCENNLHDDYYRSISDANKCNYKCPHCVRQRKESILQKKVRTYIELFNYTILHEYNCTIIPQNPKINNKRGRMPFDNEIKELKLIIEVHGEQHYRINGFHRKSAKQKKITVEESFNLQKERDKYKRIFALSQGYFYLEIPYWTDDKEETWKKLIDDKIKEVRLVIERSS